jgi:hypothetical protein
MRDACSARRIPTNTPLQALVTLNDPAFIEMAQALAGRMEKAGADPAAQIAFGARLLTLADPPPGMVQSLVKLFDGALRDFGQDAAASGKLGATPHKAALVLVANALLNTDMALNR